MTIFQIPGYPSDDGSSYYIAEEDLTVLLLEIPKDFRWEVLQGPSWTPGSDVQKWMEENRYIIADWIWSYIA